MTPYVFCHRKIFIGIISINVHYIKEKSIKMITWYNCKMVNRTSYYFRCIKCCYIIA